MVHGFSKEWNKWTHQDINIQKDVKQNVQWDFPVQVINLPFDSDSVKSDIPIGQVFEEGDQGWDDIVEFVFTHLFSDALDESLKRWLDPFVCDVETFVETFHVFNEFKFCFLFVFPFCDVLDQESVSIVPWQEDFSNNGLDTIFCKAQIISSD